MSCSTDICIVNSGLYNDNYTISGQYYSIDFYENPSSSYYIFYSQTELRWCLAANLGDPCILFGPTSPFDPCPDFYSGILVNGICPTPTPTPTLPCVIDFDAIFDCQVDPTPTPTPTNTVTPTNTITPSTTNVCGGVSLDVSANTYTPTPTPTNTQTPTPSPQVNRPCNFDGLAKFNSVDGYIVCATSKKFEDCYTGIESYTTQTLFDSDGNLLVIGDVYGGTINGIGSCFIFQAIVDNISGTDNVIINVEYGPSSDGSCLDCIPPKPTPTPTKTPTPTPTPQCNCGHYQISGITDPDMVTIEYVDCNTGVLTLLRPGYMGWANFVGHTIILCSSSTPTLGFGTASIVQIGNCCSPSCLKYYVTNNSPLPANYTYTNINGVTTYAGIFPNNTVIVSATTTPYSTTGQITIIETGISCSDIPSIPSPTPTRTPTMTPTSSPTTNCCVSFTNLKLPGGTVFLNGVTLTFASTQPAGLSILPISTIQALPCFPWQSMVNCLSTGNGQINWDYTINFNQPVNNVKIQIIRYDTNSTLQIQEKITFTTDTNIPTIFNCDGCNVLVQNNSIISIPIPGSTNGTGDGSFTISTTTPFNSLTLTPTMLGANPNNKKVQVFIRICELTPA
jgi:hypothetical protein